MGPAAPADLGSGIMNIDVEFHIRHNYPWSKLPANVRQVRLCPARLAPDGPGLGKTGPRRAPAPNKAGMVSPGLARSSARKLYKPGACAPEL